MDRIGNHILARSRFSQQQYRAVQRGDLAYHFHDVFQPGTRADNGVAGEMMEFPVEVAVVVRQQLLEPQDLPVPQAVGEADGKWIV